MYMSDFRFNSRLHSYLAGLEFLLHPVDSAYAASQQNEQLHTTALAARPPVPSLLSSGARALIAPRTHRPGWV